MYKRQIVDGNHRVNRALKAGGDAVGATCVINDLPGYLPMRNDERMNALLRENSNPIFGESNVYQGPHITASTDMGDVSHLMPVIHPWVGCISGVLDVYKRQAIMMVKYGIINCIKFIIICSYKGNTYESVSYTHLDVYKRQLKKNVARNVLLLYL